ncbi:hypothetical protein ACN42_g9115 [Penicillium freii]|uniref:Uncharacterized protein n=1 Tax=Penicillium freii TaxID=48697 RepID=A0A101MCI3_PENFR|nr:hypothetical protein ACN42_g9115 [Penicillium freii]
MICILSGGDPSSAFGFEFLLHNCHVTHYIYRSLVYLSITLRYSGLFGLVCNSPVQGQVVTQLAFLFTQLIPGLYFHNDQGGLEVSLRPVPQRIVRSTSQHFLPGLYLDCLLDFTYIRPSSLANPGTRPSIISSRARTCALGLVEQS